ncbi:hypothetical protein MKK70_13475 [Methylobacterium sp. E-041]|uniref:hypothetical protein n=1 Tax=Methylobacterium sp. E-041 TaxID=2836573 RepID=UPI001FB89B30|nr:hypothetical protein [Methylobacterium sp. E-041]MCJ2106374.1 hypothetical protein [Methylobacterium sp. E-041]
MTAMNEAFWTELDARIATDRLTTKSSSTLKVIPLASTTTSTTRSAESTEGVTRTVADWTQVLDTVSAAKGTAQEREAQLREESITRAALTADLQLAQQEIHAFRTLLQETRAQADARVHEAEERARAAELRAKAAEIWLKQIEQATRGLLPDSLHPPCLNRIGHRRR